jgi:hypothetical protein
LQGFFVGLNGMAGGPHEPATLQEKGVYHEEHEAHEDLRKKCCFFRFAPFVSFAVKRKRQRSVTRPLPQGTRKTYSEFSGSGVVILHDATAGSSVFP